MQFVSWIDPGLHNEPGFPKKIRRWVHNHLSIAECGFWIADFWFRFAQTIRLRIFGFALLGHSYYGFRNADCGFMVSLRSGIFIAGLGLLIPF